MHFSMVCIIFIPEFPQSIIFFILDYIVKLCLSPPMNMRPTHKIRILSEHSINRIAAGEVIERPASAVKELIENAIDAGARNIEVTFRDGGKTLLLVVDDGHGIPPDELPIAIQRHATSKITDVNIDDIQTLGFRGEALPSMGAAGHLSITSRHSEFDTAYHISVKAGEHSPVVPAALGVGTVIELTKLFHSTPARLKFLKSDLAETRAIIATAKSLALASPNIGFSLHEKTGVKGRRKIFSLKGSKTNHTFPDKLRLNQLIDTKFMENSFEVEGELNSLSLFGYCSYPTYHRSSSSALYFFVNNRPVKDKLLIGALRGAYADVIPKQKYPLVIVYITCPHHLVDVNVHPTKAEVRFQNPGLVRTLIVKSIKEKLAEVGYETAPVISTQYITKRNREKKEPYTYQGGFENPLQNLPKDLIEGVKPISGLVQEEVEQISQLQNNEFNYPLGVAFVQLHKNYIVSQTPNGFIIVDQHAAHERIVYERLKKQWEEKKPETITCLVPEIIELTPSEKNTILEITSELKEIGLVIEPFGTNAICVREIPALLSKTAPEKLIKDLVDGLEEGSGVEFLEEKMNAVISRISCHGSIRSGRELTLKEMNDLLRQMERTPLSGQCNHGRPTYVEFKLKDIETLFGRK